MREQGKCGQSLSDSLIPHFATPVVHPSGGPLIAPDPSPAPRPDEDLAIAHSRGDLEAFSILFERYRGRVMSYASRMLGRRELAEEVCATTFLRVVEGRYSPIGSFRSYVFAVAHRACLEQLRKRRTALRFVPWLQPTAPERTPEEEALRTDRQRQLDAAMDRLPEEHRNLLLLYYGQELASREVAAIVGCTDQQVRSRLAYARRLLRQELDEGGDP